MAVDFQHLKRHSAEVRRAAKPLFLRLNTGREEQESYLARLTLKLLQAPASPERGRKVFFSKKIGCYACHQVDGEGGRAGPDLSHVGRFRGPRDLLEAVVFPSASIAEDYRQYAIVTRQGKVYGGMIARQEGDAIYLRTAGLAEIRVARVEVKSMAESTLSNMPQGLEKTMSARDLADLLEFLSRRR